MELRKMYHDLGISDEVYDFGERILETLKERFANIDEVAEYNQLKVLSALQKHQVSEACLLGTTGYGYNDLGRDTLEEVYADSVDGASIYRRSLCFILAAAAHNLFPGRRLVVGHSLGYGFYYTLETETPLTQENIDSLKSEMMRIVKEDYDIENFSISDAVV